MKHSILISALVILSSPVFAQRTNPRAHGKDPVVTKADCPSLEKVAMLAQTNPALPAERPTSVRGNSGGVN